MSRARGSGGKSLWLTSFDGSPVGSQPIAACALGAGVALAFLAQWWWGAAESPYPEYLVGGLHAKSVMEGEVFRLVTSPLLHHDVTHMLANASVFLSLGAILEAQIGHARFLLVVGLSMLAGTIAGVVLLPSPWGVAVGSSAALFGMLGAWEVLVLRQRHDPPPLLRRLGRVIPILLVLALVSDLGFSFLSCQKIGWMLHLGGLAGGTASMALLSRGAGSVPFGRAPRGMRLAAAGLVLVFLLGVAVDLQRVASGRICEVLERDDLDAVDRAGFTEALRKFPVACANLGPEPPPATR
jgi:membrane associated rhomboid family serine protease